MKQKNLLQKELLFCSHYAQLQNARESAARAGYSKSPENAGARLLKRPEIIKEIRRQCARLENNEEASAGFRRLAFGTISDAVSLLFAPEPPSREALDNMDLFNISEIKRDKDGGIFIKFFDRQKALEQLSAIAGSKDDKAGLSFYKALIDSSRGQKISRETEGYDDI